MPLGRSAPSSASRTHSTLASPTISGRSSASRTSNRKTVSGRRGLSVLTNMPPSEMLAEYSLMKLEKCSNSSTTSRSSGTRRLSSGGVWVVSESLISKRRPRSDGRSSQPKSTRFAAGRRAGHPAGRPS